MRGGSGRYIYPQPHLIGYVLDGPIERGAACGCHDGNYSKDTSTYFLARSFVLEIRSSRGIVFFNRCFPIYSLG